MLSSLAKVVECFLADVQMLLTATLGNVSTEDELSFVNVQIVLYSERQELLYACTNLIDAIALKYLLDSYRFDVLSRTELIALGLCFSSE